MSEAPIPLSKQEIYLYAQLVSLFNDQAAALNKIAEGRAGFWTKGRVGSRTGRIKGVMGDIVRIEIASGGGPISYALQRMEKKMLSNLGSRIGIFVPGAPEYAGTFIGEIASAIDVEEFAERLYEINAPKP